VINKKKKKKKTEVYKEKVIKDQEVNMLMKRNDMYQKEE
jgi:hypothetical protein